MASCRKKLLSKRYVLHSKWFHITFTVIVLCGTLYLYRRAPFTAFGNNIESTQTLKSDKNDNVVIGAVNVSDITDKNVDQSLQDNRADTLKFRVNRAEGINQTHVPNPSEIPVLIIFTNSRANPNLVIKFRGMVSSMLKYCTAPLVIYIIGDKESQLSAEKIVQEEKPSTVYRMVHVDIDDIIKEISIVVKDMQKHFSYSSNSYYGQSLFFLSIAIHRVTAFKLGKVILLDCDIKFNTDIKNLYSYFENFTQNNIMGLANENQPVYRHTFSYYRSQNPGTRVGDPPPNGLTGFNSGVLLLDINKMRDSTMYNSLINSDSLQRLTQKYFFKGHLGDQDFFTLLSMEHEDLFYKLPCSWNRQLCVWWRDKGYEAVFDLYFKCEEKINIYHGNCNTPIP